MILVVLQRGFEEEDAGWFAGVEGTNLAGDWPREACARSYVSIPGHRTMYDMPRKRGCEAKQDDETIRLDWKARRCAYVCACMCDVVNNGRLHECDGRQLLDESLNYGLESEAADSNTQNPDHKISVAPG